MTRTMRASRRSGCGVKRTAPSRTASHAPLPLLAIAGLNLLAMYGIVSHSRERARDLDGVASHLGSGTVTNVTTIAGTHAQDPATRPVLLELDGRPVNLNLADPTWADWLYVGQKVSYTYRVGRGGTWYIDQIAPANQSRGAASEDRR